MENSDKSNLIIDEANEIVENYIKRKFQYRVKSAYKPKNFSILLLLSILTITIVLMLFYIIKII